MSPCFFKYMHSTSWEMLGWKKHKIESSLPGEMSIASDMQMTPPLGHKAKRNWRASWWKRKREWKSWLKTQLSKKEDHGVWSHHFTANRWGNNGNSDTLFSWKSFSYVRPLGLYSPWNSPGQNAGVGSYSLLQGILPTQGLNLGLPHYRQIRYYLSNQRIPVAQIHPCK